MSSTAENDEMSVDLQDVANDFMYHYERSVRKQDGGKGNFRLLLNGDVAPRQERRKHQNKPKNNVTNRVAHTTVHGVVTSEYKNKGNDGGIGEKNAKHRLEGDAAMQNASSQNAPECRDDKNTTDKDVSDERVSMKDKNKKRKKKPRIPNWRALPKDHKITSIQVSNAVVGHIIGKKGRVICALKAEYAVECMITEKSSRRKQKVHIWGPVHGVDGALNKVNQIVQRTLKEHK